MDAFRTWVPITNADLHSTVGPISLTLFRHHRLLTDGPSAGNPDIVKMHETISRCGINYVPKLHLRAIIERHVIRFVETFAQNFGSLAPGRTWPLCTCSARNRRIDIKAETCGKWQVSPQIGTY